VGNVILGSAYITALLPVIASTFVLRQHTLSIIKSNTADRVLVVGAGFTEAQKDTRQLKSRGVKSKDVLIVQRSVATL
jgi:hypothetical protein